jgi:Cyclin
MNTSFGVASRADSVTPESAPPTTTTTTTFRAVPGTVIKDGEYTTSNGPQTPQNLSSPPHQNAKSRSGSPFNVRIVPRRFAECPMSDLTVLVSSMMQELVTINDALPFNPDQLTRFHSRSSPGISIKDYLVRIIKFCTLEKSIVLSMIYFIDLLCTTYATFNINSLTVHRFMITAAMVASKGLCDSFCTNSHYARVGGLSKAEINLLEVEFLTRVDYRIVPTLELLDQYYDRMVSRLEGTYAYPPLSASSKQHHSIKHSIKEAALSFSKFVLPSEVAKREKAKSSSKRRQWGEDTKEEQDPVKHAIPGSPKRPKSSP